MISSKLLDCVNVRRIGDPVVLRFVRIDSIQSVVIRLGSVAVYQRLTSTRLPSVKPERL